MYFSWNLNQNGSQSALLMSFCEEPPTVLLILLWAIFPFKSRLHRSSPDASTKMSCGSHSTFQSNADLFLPKWYSHLDVSSFILSLTLSQLPRWLSGCFFLLLYQPWEGCRCNDGRLQTSPLAARHLASYLCADHAPVRPAGIVTCRVQQWPPHSALVALMPVLLSPDPNLSAAAHLESEPFNTTDRTWLKITSYLRLDTGETCLPYTRTIWLQKLLNAVLFRG